MVGGSLLGIVFLTILDWSILEFFIAIAVLNILFMAYIFSKVPEFKKNAYIIGLHNSEFY